MMRVLPGSLKGQLILLTLAATLLSQFVSLMFTLDDQRSRMKNVWLHNILSRIATAREVIEATPPELHDKILKSVDNWALQYSIAENPFTSEKTGAGANLRDHIKRVFRSRADRVVVTLDALQSEEPLVELLFGDIWHGIAETFARKSPDGAGLAPLPPYAHISAPLQGGKWLNVLVLHRGLRSPTWPLLVQFTTMAAISAAGIFIVLGRLTRPMKNLAKAASALGHGETARKLEEEGPDEVAGTIRAFNEMQERLTTFVHDRAKMLAALGHDLRTPITSLRLRAEFIEDDEIREQILRTLDEMSSMAEATLSFAREEAAQEESRLVDVGALISSMCEDLADTGLAVTCADTDGFALRCRQVAIKRALRNIVENAVAYGKCARVLVEYKNGEARVMIDDDGPGIPNEDMEKVFKPFVRLEQSRNKETGGVGLGLAIARSAIRSHGGDIFLINRPGGGLRVIVTFDKALVREIPHHADALEPEVRHQDAA
jgi:signal transduction histidine kinase